MKTSYKILAWEKMKFFSISLSCSSKRRKVVEKTDQATEVGIGRGNRREKTFVRTTYQLIPSFQSCREDKQEVMKPSEKPVPTHWDPCLLYE